MYRSILVPLDGSSFGEHALPLAAGIARRAGAKLSLVHVHQGDVEAELPTLTPYQFEGLNARALERRSTEEESEYLAAIGRRLCARSPLALATTMLGGTVPASLERHV
ncbi:MAG TPA: universal stress protein, partial [Longimicrobiales bacterium]